MGMKIAIVGLSDTTHDLAPFGSEEWELWGLPWDNGYVPRYDRLFEMHDIRLLESEHSKRKEGYIDELKNIEVPLYMQESYFDNAIKYPDVGIDYLNSSIAYMIALAIYEEAEEIAIYGVDMKGDDEYGYQKPNIEYLLGIAEGKGIKVIVPEKSPLLKFNDSGIWFYDFMPKYIGRYGYLG